MTFLLDVNVLIALIDPIHVAHDAAHLWFQSQGTGAWATCPMTENGLVRIVGHPKYSNSLGSPAAAMASLSALCDLSGHAFWPDDISLMSANHVDAGQILTSAQVTDSYLLALAAKNHGKLATFDRRLSTKAVRTGKSVLHVIGGN